MDKKQKTISLGKEAESTNWEDMNYDVLLKIFNTLSLIDLVLNVPWVCKSWRSVCTDASLWETLDLTTLSKYPWQDDHMSLTRFWHMLRNALNLSGGNLNKLVFHSNIDVRDQDLAYTAIRTPSLKHLVLPAWNKITFEGFQRAFSLWEGLESVVIPGCNYPSYIFQSLGENCKNLKSLKVMCPFDIICASSTVTNLPWLNALSIQTTVLQRDALSCLLDKAENLEELNIVHCLLVGDPAPHPHLTLEQHFDQATLQKASRLRKFYICKFGSCAMCVNDRSLAKGSGLKWPEVWRLDEIDSLSY